MRDSGLYEIEQMNEFISALMDVAGKSVVLEPRIITEIASILNDFEVAIRNNVALKAEVEKGNKAIIENCKLRLEVERLRDALEEYADTSNWVDDGYDDVWNGNDNGWDVARQALEVTK